MTDAPERIYLQWTPELASQATWCTERVDDEDISYIREKIAQAEIVSLRTERDEAFGRFDKQQLADAHTVATADAIARAAEAVELSAWKHGGDDGYSAGMDAGARHQSAADLRAILALTPSKPEQAAARVLLAGAWPLPAYVHTYLSTMLYHAENPT
jgi:hypothetical protein